MYQHCIIDRVKEMSKLCWTYVSALHNMLEQTVKDCMSKLCWTNVSALHNRTR